jgi:hypothetical protein
MIRKLGRKSNKYLFTIALDNEEDLKALSDIKKRVKVYVKYRRPELPYYPNGNMYGYGGTIKLSQNPREADVYLENV